MRKNFKSVEAYLRALLSVVRSKESVESELNSAVLVALGAVDGFLATGQLEPERAEYWVRSFRLHQGSSHHDSRTTPILARVQQQDLIDISNSPSPSLEKLEQCVIVDKVLAGLYISFLELYADGIVVRWRAETAAGEGLIRDALMGRLRVAGSQGELSFAGSGSFSIDRRVRGESVYSLHPPRRMKSIRLSLGSDAMTLKLRVL